MTPDSKERADFAGSMGRTDASGDFIIAPVLKNRSLQICASDPAHESKCANAFTMGETAEKQIALALPAAVKREGQVAGIGPITMGMVMWFSRDGRITEMLSFSDPDGKFTFKRDHVEGEIVVFTAGNGPLHALFQPRVDPGALFLIQVPPAPRRTFTVKLSENSTEKAAFMALLIGEVVVPVNALVQHLRGHHVQPSLRPGWTATIPDVVESGPISVILVPISTAAHYTDLQIQLPLVPEMASFPRQPLGNAEGVVFE